jgi:hypothetical protein
MFWTGMSRITFWFLNALRTQVLSVLSRPGSTVISAALLLRGSSVPTPVLRLTAINPKPLVGRWEMKIILAALKTNHG